MKRVYWALSESQLMDAVQDYEVELMCKSDVTWSHDRDGAYIQGPVPQVDAMIHRIRDDHGVDFVYDEIIASDDDVVSLDEVDGDWPAPEHDDHAENMDYEDEGDDVSFMLQA